MIEQLRHKVQNPDVRIQLALIGGTMVWAIQLLTIYSLTSLACFWGWFAAPADGSELKVVQTVITVIAAGLVVALGLLVFQEWRRPRAATDLEDHTVRAARIQMLAFVTLLLNSLYLLIMLVMLAPVLLLPGCRL